MAHRFSKEELDEQFEQFLKEVCLCFIKRLLTSLWVFLPLSPFKHTETSLLGMDRV